MRAGPVVLVAWGTLLLVNAGVQLAFTVHAPQLALLGGAGAACVAAGLLWAAAQRWPAPDGVLVLPRRAPGVAIAALGAALTLVGAEAGVWLVLIGGGIAAGGLGLLVRDLRLERRR